MFGKKPARLSEADVAKAVEHFRRPRALVWFEGHPGGNEGFSATISFNADTYEGDNGFIELALREASLRFEPDHPVGWNWSEYVREFVKNAVDSVGMKLALQQMNTKKGETTAKGGVSAEGGLNLGILSGRASAQSSLVHTHSRQVEETHNAEASRTQRERWAEMTRPEGRFQLRLTSPPGDDLVRFNAELDRVPMLAAPEPSAVDAEMVKVSMLLQVKDELRHALRIRDAGGAWAELSETRNKQIVSELRFNKFLKPMHQPVRLWPRPKRRK